MRKEWSRNEGRQKVANAAGGQMSKQTQEKWQQYILVGKYNSSKLSKGSSRQCGKRRAMIRPTIYRRSENRTATRCQREIVAMVERHCEVHEPVDHSWQPLVLELHLTHGIKHIPISKSTVELSFWSRSLRERKAREQNGNAHPARENSPRPTRGQKCAEFR